jgi:thiosulfate reductase cytochrome b subunit
MTTTETPETAPLLAGWTRMADAAEMLWVVLANVSGGDWTKQSPEWNEAASRWRDDYFEALTVYLKHTRPPEEWERLARVETLQKERPPHGH